MRFLKYAARRLAVLPLQLLAVSLIVFFLVRLLPGDPSYLLAGPFATVDRVEPWLTLEGLRIIWERNLTQKAREVGASAKPSIGAKSSDPSSKPGAASKTRR